MIVGLARVQLVLHGSMSLKDKRRVTKSVVTRLRSRFNVAVAEVDELESWGRLTLGIACVSNEAGHAHAVLEKAIRAIERERLDADLADYEIELL